VAFTDGHDGHDQRIATVGAIGDDPKLCTRLIGGVTSCRLKKKAAGPERRAPAA